MDLASSCVKLATAPEPSRTPLLLTLPGNTIIRLLPMLRICSCIRSVAPDPTPTIAITAATPMMMPSIVSAERMRFTFSARSAIRLLATILFMTVPLLCLLDRYQRQILGGIAWIFETLVELQPSVLKMDIPAAVRGDFGIVRHHNDGDSLFAIQLLE